MIWSVPTYGYHGEVEWEEVSPGEEAREDVKAAHVDAAVQRQQHKQASCTPSPHITNPELFEPFRIFI